MKSKYIEEKIVIGEPVLDLVGKYVIYGSPQTVYKIKMGLHIKLSPYRDEDWRYILVGDVMTGENKGKRKRIVTKESQVDFWRDMNGLYSSLAIAVTQL